MATTHTPGPWSVRSWADDEHYIREIWTRDFEDEDTGEFHIGDSIRRVEDARLAAAPDLLDALRRVIRHIPAGWGGASLSDDLHRAYAAITRAIRGDE